MWSQPSVEDDKCGCRASGWEPGQTPSSSGASCPTDDRGTLLTLTLSSTIPHLFFLTEGRQRMTPHTGGGTTITPSRIDPEEDGTGPGSDSSTHAPPSATLAEYFPSLAHLIDWYATQCQSRGLDPCAQPHLGVLEELAERYDNGDPSGLWLTWAWHSLNIHQGYGSALQAWVANPTPENAELAQREILTRSTDVPSPAPNASQAELREASQTYIEIMNRRAPTDFRAVMKGFSVSPYMSFTTALARTASVSYIRHRERRPSGVRRQSRVPRRNDEDPSQPGDDDPAGRQPYRWSGVEVAAASSTVHRGAVSR